MKVWLVVKAWDYEGENAHDCEVFGTPEGAAAKANEWRRTGPCGPDAVNVHEKEVQ